MRKKVAKQKKVRVTIDLSERAYDRLTSLKLRSDAATVAEVLRRALATYEVVLVARERGEELWVHRNGEAGERVVVVKWIPEETFGPAIRVPGSSGLILLRDDDEGSAE